MVGCRSTRIKVGSQTWYLPSKPEIEHVEIVVITEADIQDDGYYLSYEDAINLADGISELKAYTKKLELLIEAIQKYHNSNEEED